MKRLAILVLLSIWGCFCALEIAEALPFQLGLLAGDTQLGEVAQAAYDWATANYPTTLLIPDGAGQFQTAERRARLLTEFGVLWFHYSATNALPDVFQTDGTKQAVMEYLQAGGTLFVTALALHYAFDLGIQADVEPRVFNPLGKDPPEIGIVPPPEAADHPIFDGFDTSGPIFLCSMAQDGFTSDFMNSGDLEGQLLATKTRGGGAGVGERPMVEFDVGQGKLITLGHHNAVYTDAKSTEGENLRQLTANVLNYLSEHSAFAPVEPVGKLTALWAEIRE